jgi:hypothetical protein
MEELSVGELREMLGVEDGKLAAYKNLNPRAIQPALTEVNALTDFAVNILTKEWGKSLVGLSMGWNLKGESGWVEATRERDRPRLICEERQAGYTDGVVVEDPTPAEGIADGRD